MFAIGIARPEVKKAPGLGREGNWQQADDDRQRILRRGSSLVLRKKENIFEKSWKGCLL